MLVLGGIGSLYGAIAGAAIFTAIHHVRSALNPYHCCSSSAPWLMLSSGAARRCSPCCGDSPEARDERVAAAGEGLMKSFGGLR